MNLLIVEDEPRVATFLVKGLTGQGYSVEHVMTGTEALERATGTDVSLVVLDLGLPDIDGMEVLRRIREAGHEVPVVILTARSDDKDRARCLKLGADDFITKPFSFGYLLSRVRTYLSDDLDESSP